MKLLDLLGLELKNEAVITVLAEHEMEIHYHVDLLFEGEPDSYSSSAQSEGFEFIFDERQILKTIFCHMFERDGFNRIDPSIVGVPLYASFVDARSEGSGFRISTGEKIQFFGQTFDWVKFVEHGYSRHYQFTSEGLDMVTLSTASR